MRRLNHILLLVFLVAGTIELLAQSSMDATGDLAFANTEMADNTTDRFNGDNGFQFEVFPTAVNSKYADYGIGFFREKFISFSARKIGALAKLDPITGEPYTKLYCSDITYEWDLKRPQLFSHILNKNENLGTIAFSKDGNKIFFTKSKEGAPDQFQLYAAVMNPERDGEWMDMKPMSFNNEAYSFENPHLSRDEKFLYFASNLPEAVGGFDIFKVKINSNGTYGDPERIDGSVNTVLDEKFPQTSLDGKYLYFSSNGHENAGGYDIFRSKKSTLGYVAVRNLGNTINSASDDIAYIPATENVGYFTSNRSGGKGSYDIYKLKEQVFDQEVAGTIRDLETQIVLPEAVVVLLDADGEEVAITKTDKNGRYSFPVDSFLDYTLLSYKDGFERNSASFNTNTNLVKTFTTDLILEATPAEIVETAEKSFIKIENILFDLNSAKVKDISTITLNTVVATLNENPEIKIAIKAHTDAQGRDAYNLSLSKRRAASAMAYLKEKGITEDRLTSQGFGESQPLIDCKPCTKEQYAQNRRVEFIIVPEDKKE